jgi:hypothetical protein
MAITGFEPEFKELHDQIPRSFGEMTDIKTTDLY